MTKVVFESTATQHLASKHILLNNKKKKKQIKKTKKKTETQQIMTITLYKVQKRNYLQI